MNLKFLKSFTVIIISKKFTSEIFFTGAPAVHRWCGEILKYRTLSGSDLTFRTMQSVNSRRSMICPQPRAAVTPKPHYYGAGGANLISFVLAYIQMTHLAFA